ncbi:MAG: SDR family NAD(P)-dependent oxidoreductase [Burkholderiales bacterium]
MRLALITGGSRGLGHALCDALTAHGWRVVEFSRSAPHAYSVRIDLAAPEAARQTIAATLAVLAKEPIDELLVVANAGTLDPIGAVSKKPPAEVLANLHTNFTSAILFIAEAVARFQATPCRKVVAVVSSGAAQRGYAGWSLYCAAKAGLENFIRSLAAEQQAEATPFLAINIVPGVVDTGMQAVIRATPAADFPSVQRFIDLKHNDALASPAQVAAAIHRIVTLPTLAQGERYDVADHRG